MSAKDCINRKAKAGRVDPGKTARLAELYEDLEADARGSMGPNAAADQAAVEAEIALARQTRQKKRRVLKQMRAQANIEARAAAHPDRVDEAMLSFLDFRPRSGVAGPKVSLRNQFHILTGRTNQPANPTIANVAQANRNVLVSAILGGAWFSALSDPVFGSITARMNGVPAARALARHLKLFAPGSQADRKLAVRLGFGAQGWASMAIAQERYLGEVIGPEWSKRLADSMLRLSFLSPWTQAGRWGFMTEFAGFSPTRPGSASLPSRSRSSGRSRNMGSARRNGT